MDATGIIFAVIDTPPANIEAWNRWYDLEHLPPNIALDGIMIGRRYVATPDLQALRRPDVPMAGFADGQGMFLTVYTLCGDPAAVIADMTAVRDELDAAGRMAGAGDRTVRMGDAMTLTWARTAAALRVGVQAEAPHIAHDAVRVVLRRGGDASACQVAEVAVTVPGVHAVMGHAATFLAGVDCDLYLLEGDPAAMTDAVRQSAPYGEDCEILVDATFATIVPFRYGFAAAFT